MSILYTNVESSEMTMDPPFVHPFMEDPNEPFFTDLVLYLIIMYIQLHNPFIPLLCRYLASYISYLLTLFLIWSFPNMYPFPNSYRRSVYTCILLNSFLMYFSGREFVHTYPGLFTRRLFENYRQIIWWYHYCIYHTCYMDRINGYVYGILEHHILCVALRLNHFNRFRYYSHSTKKFFLLDDIRRFRHSSLNSIEPSSDEISSDVYQFVQHTSPFWKEFIRKLSIRKLTALPSYSHTMAILECTDQKFLTLKTFENRILFLRNWFSIQNSCNLITGNIMDLVGNQLEQLCGSNARLVEDLIIFIIYIRHSSSNSMRFLAVHDLLRKRFPTDKNIFLFYGELYKYMFPESEVPAAVDFTPSVTGSLDVLESWVDDVDTFRQGTNFSAFVKLATCAAAHCIIGEGTFSSLSKIGLIRQVDLIRWKDGVDVTDLIVGVIRSSITIVRNILGTDDVQTNISSSNGFCRNVDWLRRHEYKRVASGAPVTLGEVADFRWLEVLAATYEARTRLPKCDPGMSQAVKMASQYLDSLYTTENMRGSGFRSAPFNMAFLGESGAGKTEGAGKLFTKAALAGLGIFPSNENFSCMLNPGDEFQPVYDPTKHHAVIYDEAGASDPRFGENYLPQQFLSMTSGGEFPLKSASIEMKGKRFFRPSVFVVCSNFDDMGFSDYIRHKPAFYRRFNIALKFAVKPCFKKDTGAGIDSAKVAAHAASLGLSAFFDVLHITPLIPADECWVPLLPDGETWEVSETVRQIQQRASEYKTILDNTKKTHTNIMEMKVCEKHNDLMCVECSNVNLMPQSDYDYIFNSIERWTMFLNNAWSFVSINKYFLLCHLFGIPAGWCLWWYYWTYFIMFTTLSISSLFTRYRSLQMSFTTRAYNYYLRSWSRLIIYSSMLSIPRSRSEMYAWSLERSKKLLELRHSHVFQLVGVLTMVAGILSFTRSAKTDVVPASDNFTKSPIPSSLEGSNPQPFRTKRNVWRRPDYIVELGPSAGDPLQIIRSKIQNNLRQARIVTSSSEKTGVCPLHLLGIKGNFAIGPWHSLYGLTQPNRYLEIIDYRSGELVVVSRMQGSAKLVKQVTHDIGMVELFTHRQFKDISKLFAVDVDYEQFTSNTSITCSYDECSPICRWEDVNTNYRNVVIPHVTSLSKAHCGVTASPCYLGRCGSPLIVSFRNRHAIAGLYIAGNFSSNYGVWEPLNIGSLDKTIGLFESQFERLRPLSNNFLHESPTLSKYIQDISPINKRNHVWYLEDIGSIHAVGSFSKGNLRRPKSDVIYLPCNETFLKIFPPEFHHNLVKPKLYGGMVGTEWMSPERHAIEDMKSNADVLNYDHLLLIRDQLIRKFSKADFKADEVVNMYSAVSGSSESDLLYSMPKSTGAGFPWGCKKKDLLYPCPTSTAPDGYMPNSDVRDEVHSYIHHAISGRRYDVVSVTCPKDEPVKPEKAAVNRCRIFTIGAIHYFIVCKMFLGIFLSLFNLNFMTTETVGGVNCFSEQWGAIFNKLKLHPRVVNGDFSRYDKKINSSIMMFVFDIILGVKRKFRNISKEEEAILRAIATDLSAPYILTGEDLLQPNGSLSSGVLMTFLVNNIANSIYIRLAYINLYLKHHSTATAQEALDHFDDNVVFFALGDDNTFSISYESLEFFDFKKIQTFFAKMGMKYTLADKSTDSYGSVPVSEATIGKRRFVPDSTGYVTAPIELTTIGKILTMGHDSGPLSSKEKQKECFKAAILELSQYEEPFYNTYSEKVRQLADECEISVNIPTWNELRTQQRENSAKPLSRKTLNALISDDWSILSDFLEA